ncbi:hypothetical protein [Chelatococcus sp.]|nr:hypothetical protein [Chelatococcus sp.]
MGAGSLAGEGETGNGGDAGAGCCGAAGFSGDVVVAPGSAAGGRFIIADN